MVWQQAKAAPKKVWVAKEKKEATGDSADAGAAATSALLQESKSSGPSYLPALLLQLRDIAAQATDQPTKEGEELASRPFKLEERPPEEPDEGPGPMAIKRAEREKKKAEKAKKQEEEAAAAGVEDPQVAEYQAQAAAAAAALGMPPLDPAFMSFLQSYPGHPMAHMPPVFPGQMPLTGYTTVMLRNIPNRYTREMLASRLDQTFKDQYDFVYLPIDFNSKCNIGYAFINFRTPMACQKFINDFHNVKAKTCLPGFSSQKVCEVSYARVQGQEANMETLKDEKFVDRLMERPEWQPLFLDEKGAEIPFSKILGMGKKRTGKGSSPQMTASFMPPYGVVPPMMSPWAMPYAAMAEQAVVEEESLVTLCPTVGPATTLMLKNIPSSLSRDDFVNRLNKDLKGSFDFVFLPCHKSGEGNRGYGFVNFLTEEKAQEFTKMFNQVTMDTCFPDVEIPAPSGEQESPKECEVVQTRLPSLEKTLARLKAAVNDSSSETPPAAWYPILFSPEGEELPYPMTPVAPTTPAAYPPQQMVATGSPSPKVLDARELEKEMEKGTTTAEASAPAEAKDEAEAKAKSAAKPAAKPKLAAARAPGPVLPGYGYPPYMSPYMGYPSAPVHPMQAHMAASAAAMAQAAATMHRHQMVHSQHSSVSTGLLEPLAAAVNPSSATPLDESSLTSLRKQIEFYFSVDNLCKDLYLRKHMMDGGWTPLELISKFPKVRAYGAPGPEQLAKALATSSKLELDDDKQHIRIKDEELRSRFSKVPDEFTKQMTPTPPK